MVRYSFLVGLFHPRLHAGLSRRLRSLTVAALPGVVSDCINLTYTLYVYSMWMKIIREF